jgi:cytochrome c oxidase subunit 3
MISEAEKKEQRQKTAKPLLWMAIVSISMIFAGLTSGYVVVQGDSFWVQAPMPKLFWVSTGVILLCSAALVFVVQSAKKGNQNGIKYGLLLTALLGVGFSVTQYKAWGEMTETGNFFVGKLSDLKGAKGIDYEILFRGEAMIFANGHYYAPSDITLKNPLDERLNNSFNVSSGFKYVLSGLHLAHLSGGLLYLIMVIFRTFKGAYTPSNTLDLELCAIYWHFLDILWIYLFAFLVFIQ